MAVTSFRYTPKLFRSARKHSGSSSLGLNNSRYDPRKWHDFKPSQAYISKNSFSSGQNRFWKIFLEHVWGCCGVEMKCFETGEHFGTAQGSFPNHMKHFEEFENFHHFSLFQSEKWKFLVRIWYKLSQIFFFENYIFSVF